MPSICGKFDRTKGIIIQIGAATAGSFHELTSTGRQQGDISGLLFPALIDTGADGTCLSQSVIKDLGIDPVSKIEVQAAGGPHSANLYRVDLILVYGNQQLILPDRHVAEFDAGKDAPYQALLGMDILSSGVLTMSFDGHFTLSH